MDAWHWALLLKPFVGIAFLAVLYFGARAVAWLLYAITPDCRLKRYLFLGYQPIGRKAFALRRPK